MKTINFGHSHQFTNGTTSSVALSDDNTLIEVHKSHIDDQLYYRIGTASMFNGNLKVKSHSLTTGIHPSVAINNSGVLVIMYQDTKEQELYYYLGQLQDGEITWWQQAVQFTSGQYPSVAITDNGVVVSVHQSTATELYYTVGSAIDNQIFWGKQTNYANGVTPNVAINNVGQVVEVHQSQNAKTLWYCAGTIEADEKLKFGNQGNEFQLEGAITPSVALSDEGQVVAMFGNGQFVFYQNGTLDGTTVNFAKASYQYGWGVEPSVACNSQMAIEVHRAHDAGDLYESVGIFADQAKWMETTDGVLDLSLWQLALPGTHDSGTYDLSDTAISYFGGNVPPAYAEGLAKEIDILTADIDLSGDHDFVENLLTQITRAWGTAQSGNLLQQLNGGIRYFDLRPAYDDGGFYTYHDLRGPNFTEILSDVQTYMKSVNKELVILNISHFNGFQDQQHAQFIDLISHYLKDYLYTTPIKNPLSPAIKAFVDDGPKVFIVYQDDYINENPTGGFFNTLKVYDDYSNTTSAATMESDQLDKWENNSGNSNRLFLLSWTLTPSNYLVYTDVKARLKASVSPDLLKDIGLVQEGRNLREFTQSINAGLAHFIGKNKDQQGPVNILYVDFFGDADVTNTAIALNIGMS